MRLCQLVSDFPGGSDGKASVYNAGDPGWEDPLEKEMAIHSRTIAWRIPWTEEPGRLQSMGSQRVGHNWATSVSQSVMINMRCEFLLVNHSLLISMVLPLVWAECHCLMPATGPNLWVAAPSDLKNFMYKWKECMTEDRDLNEQAHELLVLIF